MYLSYIKIFRSVFFHISLYLEVVRLVGLWETVKAENYRRSRKEFYILVYMRIKKDVFALVYYLQQNIALKIFGVMILVTETHTMVNL